MKCQKYEKWISDALDGALSEKKKRRLEFHLTGCPDCRACQERLKRIQEEALRLERAEVSPSYWEEFSFSLGRKMSALEHGREARRAFRLTWKWAWAGAAVFLTAALSLVFFRTHKPAPENIIFSYEACLDRLHQEIGDNARLEDNFNSVILVSLREGLDSEALEERCLLSEDPFFWESLSEEELEFIEQEIKKEIKS